MATTLFFLILSSFSIIEALQICPSFPVNGEPVDIEICRNIQNGDIYWNETVKFIQVNFVEEYCDSFYEDVFLSDSRLIRINSKTIYMPSKAFHRPSCIPKQAIYLLNGLFYIPLQKKRNLTISHSNKVANKLAIKICDNYKKFVEGGRIHSISETKSFVRQIYGSDNVTGYISNGIIYLLHCIPIFDVNVISSKKIQEYCYEKIPVIVKNSTLMFTTLGIDLEIKSKREECEPISSRTKTIWENNVFLRCSVLLLFGMLFFLLLIDILGIVFLINESKENKNDGFEYNDFLFKLVNESIKEINTSKEFNNFIGFEDDFSPNVNEEFSDNDNPHFQTFSNDKRKTEYIQFYPAPPRPHPFDAILNKQDKVSITDGHFY